MHSVLSESTSEISVLLHLTTQNHYTSNTEIHKSSKKPDVPHCKIFLFNNNQNFSSWNCWSSKAFHLFRSSVFTLQIVLIGLYCTGFCYKLLMKIYRFFEASVQSISMHYYLLILLLFLDLVLLLNLSPIAKLIRYSIVFLNMLPDYTFLFHSKCKSSVESQNCVIANQGCSIENQKGAIAVQKSMAIAPFWFSMEHLWTAITPFWLSPDEV